jgi:hypothetical protein
MTYEPRCYAKLLGDPSYRKSLQTFLHCQMTGRLYYFLAAFERGLSFFGLNGCFHARIILTCYPIINIGHTSNYRFNELIMLFARFSYVKQRIGEGRRSASLKKWVGRSRSGVPT